MKYIYLLLISTTFLLAQNGQNQNVVVRPSVGVVLQSTPYGDCRQQFYNQGFTLQNAAYVCNTTNGVWTQLGANGFAYIGALASIPSTCTIGQVSFITDASPGQNQYNCTAANTWTQNTSGSTIGCTPTGSPATGTPLVFANGTGTCAWESLATAGIAPTGVDINTSGQVTATHLASPTTCTAPTVVTAISAGAVGTCATIGLPPNSQSAAYTTVLADAGKHILHPTSDNNARTFTIDSNANVAYPLGTTLTFVNLENTVTIAITSDTLILAGPGSTGSRTLAANGIATALKVGTTTWIISGNGIS